MIITDCRDCIVVCERCNYDFGVQRYVVIIKGMRGRFEDTAFWDDG